MKPLKITGLKTTFFTIITPKPAHTYTPISFQENFFQKNGSHGATKQANVTKMAKLTKNGNFLLFGDGDSGIGACDGSTMVQNNIILRH